MAKDVAEQHAELVHYTTAAGLSGILSSGSLWATHAAFLNDAVEMTHFFDARLPDIAFTETLQYVQELAHTPSIAEQIKSDGGAEKIARDQANVLASNLRAVTLKFNHPYIFSMSAPRSAQAAQSGLLSQWRGYGRDGGYAIVFNTKGFDQLLKTEGQTFQYQFAQWGDVHYYGLASERQPSTEDVEEMEAVVRKGVAKLLRGGTAEETDGFYEALSGLSCLYKHWGFWEESEVRVIAVPADHQVAKLAIAQGETKPEKHSNNYLRSGVPVPYIELFSQLGGATGRLPIARVVIGPHRDKVLRAEAVKRLLFANGYEAEVIWSEIPYIGS